jgi:hypothetical protein
MNQSFKSDFDEGEQNNFIHAKLSHLCLGQI